VNLSPACGDFQAKGREAGASPKARELSSVDCAVRHAIDQRLETASVG